MNTTGALLGLAAGLGTVLTWWRISALRPRLVHRVEPYLREPISTSSLFTTHTPFPHLERVLRPILSDVGRVLDRLGSPAHDVRSRLIRAGLPPRVENFRIEQIIWGTLAMGAGLFLAIVIASLRNASWVALVLLVVVAGIGGALARDYMLSRQVRSREKAMTAEFPTIAELLALAVGAGESPLAALDRLTRITHGVLSTELAAALADVRSGVPLPAALIAMADRTQVPAISRFTSGVAVAIERGTPLAQVLRAQAQDARTATHQHLMELGGKKEISMMVPVVFLLLPITVMFALFPGIHILSLT